MGKDAIRSITWEAVTDWNNLSDTLENKWHQFFVSEEDVDIFVQKMLLISVQETGITYEELLPIFEENNAEFYAEKKKIFKTYLGLSKTSPRLRDLEVLLKIPVLLKADTKFLS